MLEPPSLLKELPDAEWVVHHLQNSLARIHQFVVQATDLEKHDFTAGFLPGYTEILFEGWVERGRFSTKLSLATQYTRAARHGRPLVIGNVVYPSATDAIWHKWQELWILASRSLGGSCARAAVKSFPSDWEDDFIPPGDIHGPPVYIHLIRAFLRGAPASQELETSLGAKWFAAYQSLLTSKEFRSAAVGFEDRCHQTMDDLKVILDFDHSSLCAEVVSEFAEARRLGSEEEWRTRVAENLGSQPDNDLSLDEVASWFGVNPSTVSRWAKNGKLQTNGIKGKGMRIKMSSAIALLKNRSLSRKGRDANGRQRKVQEGLQMASNPERPSIEIKREEIKRRKPT